MSLFRDMMDRERFVSIIGEEGAYHKVRVYFQGPGGRMLYHGNTMLAKSLFEKRAMDYEYGFCPAAKTIQDSMGGSLSTDALGAR